MKPCYPQTGTTVVKHSSDFTQVQNKTSIETLKGKKMEQGARAKKYNEECCSKSSLVPQPMRVTREQTCSVVERVVMMLLENSLK